MQQQPKEQGSIKARYDTNKLKNKNVLETFMITLQNRYQALEDESPDGEEEDEIEKDFHIMEEAYTKTTEEVLGRSSKKRKQWITEESWALVDQREEINKKILSTYSERIKKRLKTKYKEKSKEVKRSIRSDKRKWMDGITSEAEDAARKQHMRTFYGLTKVLCNERSRSSTAIPDKSGNLVSGKKEMQSRWTEHFREVLNREEPTDPRTKEDRCEFVLSELIEEIAITEPIIEVRAAIERLKNGKSPGVDFITAELLKVHKDFSAANVHQLLEKVWRHEKIPDKWKRGLIITLPKMANLKECKNLEGNYSTFSRWQDTWVDRDRLNTDWG